MNKKDRKRLKDLIEQAEGIASEIEEMQSEEQDKFNNLPDSIQGSEQGEAIQEAADNLQEIYDDLTNWCDDAKTTFEL